jgi:hypothetical protein
MLELAAETQLGDILAGLAPCNDLVGCPVMCCLSNTMLLVMTGCTIL